MAEKLALKKALFDELKKTNERIKELEQVKEPLYPELRNNSLIHLKSHKDFIQRLIDICVDRNKF